MSIRENPTPFIDPKALQLVMTATRRWYGHSVIATILRWAAMTTDFSLNSKTGLKRNGKSFLDQERLLPIATVSPLFGVSHRRTGV